MTRISIFLTSLLFVSIAYAKNTNHEATIQTTAFSDGIEFQMSESNTDMQLTIVGPANTRFTQHYSGDAAVFLDINNTGGTVLTDGQYKYEAWPIPAVTISREESLRMPDRNSLHHLNTPAVSSVSGTFRIVNGMIPDPELKEFDQQTGGENLK